MATIITKNSQTASAVPSAASLEVGELAVNTADGKLYTEHTGGVVKEIIPSTVANGGITEAKIATGAVTADKIGSSAVTTAKIADANVTGAKLENSGVTAGTYTTATVTVDAKGRVTSASSGSGGGVSSLNGQTGAITNTTSQAIGSYIFCYFQTSASVGQVIHGTTYAGTSMFRYNYNTGQNAYGQWFVGQVYENFGGCSYKYMDVFKTSRSNPNLTTALNLAGTWRLMSYVVSDNNQDSNTLWFGALVRIS